MYNVIRLVLDTKPKYMMFNPSFIGIVMTETTADISNVRISINGGPMIPINELLPINLTVPAQVIIDWDDSEDMKTLVLIVSDIFIPLAKRMSTSDVVLQQIYDVVSGAYNSVPVLKELVVTEDVGYGGNMYSAFSGLMVYSTMYVSDEALVRVWGSAVIEGGRIVITDNAKLVLSGV